MSKYLDFIGQQISQSKSQQGSQNEDLEALEDNGVMAQVKKHGLKVAGGLAVVAGSVFAYKHFTKKDNEILVDEALTLQVESTPTKIHDFTSKQDAEKEGRGEEFEEAMARLEAASPSMEEIMAFDDDVLEDQSKNDSLEAVNPFADEIDEVDEISVSKGQGQNLEDLFGLQMPQSTNMEDDNQDDEEGSAAIETLEGADLFSGASLNSGASIPGIEPKFSG